MVQLARDLQADFYPYFKDFFPILVSISNCQNAEMIEVSRNFFMHHFFMAATGVDQHVFTSMAYLFKFLWRHMIKDIPNIYK